MAFTPDRAEALRERRARHRFEQTAMLSKDRCEFMLEEMPETTHP
jgi:hypothetical protein